MEITNITTAAKKALIITPPRIREEEDNPHLPVEIKRSTAIAISEPVKAEKVT